MLMKKSFTPGGMMVKSKQHVTSFNDLFPLTPSAWIPSIDKTIFPSSAASSPGGKVLQVDVSDPFDPDAFMLDKVNSLADNTDNNDFGNDFTTEGTLPNFPSSFHHSFNPQHHQLLNQQKKPFDMFNVGFPVGVDGKGGKSHPVKTDDDSPILLPFPVTAKEIIQSTEFPFTTPPESKDERKPFYTPFSVPISSSTPITHPPSFTSPKTTPKPTTTPTPCHNYPPTEKVKDSQTQKAESSGDNGDTSGAGKGEESPYDVEKPTTTRTREPHTVPKAVTNHEQQNETPKAKSPAHPRPTPVTKKTPTSPKNTISRKSMERKIKTSKTNTDKTHQTQLDFLSKSLENAEIYDDFHSNDEDHVYHSQKYVPASEPIYLNNLLLSFTPPEDSSNSDREEITYHSKMKHKPLPPYLPIESVTISSPMKDALMDRNEEELFIAPEQEDQWNTEEEEFGNLQEHHLYQ